MYVFRPIGSVAHLEQHRHAWEEEGSYLLQLPRAGTCPAARAHTAQTPSCTLRNNWIIKEIISILAKMDNERNIRLLTLLN